MMDMNGLKTKGNIVWYDDEEDVLGIQITKDKNDKYWKSIELPNGVIIDISNKGRITGIEVLRATKVFKGEAVKVINVARSDSKK